MRCLETSRVVRFLTWPSDAITLRDFQTFCTFWMPDAFRMLHPRFVPWGQLLAPIKKPLEDLLASLLSVSIMEKPVAVTWHLQHCSYCNTVCHRSVVWLRTSAAPAESLHTTAQSMSTLFSFWWLPDSHQVMSYTVCCSLCDANIYLKSLYVEKQWFLFVVYFFLTFLSFSSSTE